MRRVDFMVLALICLGAAMTRLASVQDAIIGHNWIGVAWFAGLVAIPVFYAFKCIGRALSE